MILAEVDFEALDTIARRKLFVGMTRARMRLIMVMSERAVKVVAEGWSQPLDLCVGDVAFRRGQQPCELGLVGRDFLARIDVATKASII